MNPLNSFALFLGAGASVDAGLPDNRILVKDVCCRIPREEVILYNEFKSALSQLEKEQSQKKYSSNVSMDDIFDSLRAVEPRTIEQESNIEILGNHVADILDEINEDNIERVSYLKPFLKLLLNNPEPYVFSLNYDKCVEWACRDLADVEFHVPSYSHKAVESLPTLHLLKLHGSIDWIPRNTLIPPRKRTSDTQMRSVNTGVRNTQMRRGGIPGAPTAIYLGGKNSRRDLRNSNHDMHSLYRLFEESLQNIATLIIIGYSFGDEDVNGSLNEWFNQKVNPPRKLIIIDPAPTESLIKSSEFGNRLYWHRGNSSRLKYFQTGLCKLDIKIFEDCCKPPLYL